jgi:hypothetical protein
MSQGTIQNPYNQATQPKEYQAWYYQNVIKPQKEAAKPQKEAQYFSNKQKYTATQLEFNRMNREELINEIFVKQEEYDPGNYMTYKTRLGTVKERSRADALFMAKQDLKDAHAQLQVDPRCHRIIDFMDIIRKNPNYTATEAFTLLELTFRYYEHRHMMTYHWIAPPAPATDEELETIIPRRTIMTIIPDSGIGFQEETYEYPERWVMTEAQHEEWVDELRKKGYKTPERDYATYVKGRIFQVEAWKQEHIDWMELHGYTEATDPEEALWEAMKTALGKLKTDWRTATDEAWTPIVSRHTSTAGQTHLFRSKSAIYHLYFELSQTFTGEGAIQSGIYKIEALEPIPK